MPVPLELTRRAIEAENLARELSQRLEVQTRLDEQERSQLVEELADAVVARIADKLENPDSTLSRALRAVLKEE